MRNITRLAIGAVMALSAATTFALPASAKAYSSWYGGYTNGYSAPYSNGYGTYGYTDRNYGRNHDWAWQRNQGYRRSERDRHSDRGYAMRDRGDRRHFGDRERG